MNNNLENSINIFTTGFSSVVCRFFLFYENVSMDVKKDEVKAEKLQCHVDKRALISSMTVVLKVIVCWTMLPNIM